MQRAAIGAGLRGSGGLVLRRVASRGAGVPSRGGASRWSQGEVSVGKPWGRNAVLRVAEPRKKCFA